MVSLVMGRQVGVSNLTYAHYHLIRQAFLWSLLHLRNSLLYGADPDGDGLDNITEYAFNLDPSTNDAQFK